MFNILSTKVQQFPPPTTPTPTRRFAPRHMCVQRLHSQLRPWRVRVRVRVCVCVCFRIRFDIQTTRLISVKHHAGILPTACTFITNARFLCSLLYEFLVECYDSSNHVLTMHAIRTHCFKIIQ